MARIFITGSADGLGQAAARRLVTLGHEVVLHGATAIGPNRRCAPCGRSNGARRRSGQHRTDARTGSTRERGWTVSGGHPQRRHRRVRSAPRDSGRARRHLRHQRPRGLLVDRAHPSTSAPDLHDVGFAPERQLGCPRPAVAPTTLERISGVRRLKTVRSRAGLRRRPSLASRPLERGRSRMGSHEDGRPSAPGDREEGVATQVWLAVSEEPGAKVTGRLFYHQRTRPGHPAASDASVQDSLLAAVKS